MNWICSQPVSFPGCPSVCTEYDASAVKNTWANAILFSISTEKNVRPEKELEIQTGWLFISTFQHFTFLPPSKGRKFYVNSLLTEIQLHHQSPFQLQNQLKPLKGFYSDRDWVPMAFKTAAAPGLSVADVHSLYHFVSSWKRSRWLVCLPVR